MTGYLHFVSRRMLANGELVSDCFHTISVAVRHLGADKYQAYFEGRWRVVRQTSLKNYVIYLGQRIQFTSEDI